MSSSRTNNTRGGAAEQRLKPIRFLDPGKTDLTVRIHPELHTLASACGKHSTEILYELALCWRRFIADGEFGVSREMLDQLYTSTFRRKFKSILAVTTTQTKNHSAYAGTATCKKVAFNLEGVETREAQGQGGEPLYVGAFSESGLAVTIPGEWLWNRYERWNAVCEEKGWVSHLDLDGRTDWGAPLRRSLESAEIPATEETKRLTDVGVVNVKRRKHGRVYHCLTNLRKDLRRASETADGEVLCEVDVSACYISLLVAELADGECKKSAVKAIHAGWYEQFTDAYGEWMWILQQEGLAYLDNEKRWKIRKDDNPDNDELASIKIEFQRQCLFWRDNRTKSNPLREELRRLYPELCESIESERRRLSASELSHVLTRAEGSMVIDSMSVELAEHGIDAIVIHDGLLVPESKVEKTLQIMHSVARWHLGFEAKIAVKGGESVARYSPWQACWEDSGGTEGLDIEGDVRVMVGSRDSEGSPADCRDAGRNQAARVGHQGHAASQAGKQQIKAPPNRPRRSQVLRLWPTEHGISGSLESSGRSQKAVVPLVR